MLFKIIQVVIHFHLNKFDISFANIVLNTEDQNCRTIGKLFPMLQFNIKWVKFTPIDFQYHFLCLSMVKSMKHGANSLFQ